MNKKLKTKLSQLKKEIRNQNLTFIKSMIPAIGSFSLSMAGFSCNISRKSYYLITLLNNEDKL